PRAIRGGDVLRIGDAAIAEVTPVVEPGPAAAEPAAAPAETASPARRASARLWIGIGVYLLVMLALIIFFATLGERPERADELATLRFLTDEQIEAEVRAPVTKRAPLAERMNENLQQARQFYELREASPDAL